MRIWRLFLFFIYLLLAENFLSAQAPRNLAGADLMVWEEFDNQFRIELTEYRYCNDNNRDTLRIIYHTSPEKPFYMHQIGLKLDTILPYVARYDRKGGCEDSLFCIRKHIYSTFYVIPYRRETNVFSYKGNCLFPYPNNLLLKPAEPFMLSVEMKHEENWEENMAMLSMIPLPVSICSADTGSLELLMSPVKGTELTMTWEIPQKYKSKNTVEGAPQLMVNGEKFQFPPYENAGLSHPGSSALPVYFRTEENFIYPENPPPGHYATTLSITEKRNGKIFSVSKRIGLVKVSP